ncbi:MAG TPA: CDP-alcohol phosphatidyltransferase family protein [Gemmatimonadaceae bacterium]|nr:CDP-alcohol phosphatidyltransferase family protein [Gemmatimonadaceae bacterium]
MTLVNRIALALAAAVILTMPIFAVVARSRPLDPEVARRPKSLLLGYWVRDWAMWIITPIERGCLRAGVAPDVFNFLGLGLSLAAGVAYAGHALSVAGWLVLLGGVSDIFDGRIARARNLASPYGAFIDSTLDRFAETFAFVGLAIGLAAAAPWQAFAVALALGSSMLVSYTRARGEALGVECKRGTMQRAERLVLLGVASIVDGAITSRTGWVPGSFLAAVILLIGLGALGTAIYRTVFISRALLHRSDTD